MDIETHQDTVTTTVTEPNIVTEEDVDRALLRLGEIERDRAQRKAGLDGRIAEMKEEFRVEGTLPEAEARIIRSALQKWAKPKRKAWEQKGRRSRALTHGEIGWRRVTKVEIPKDEANFIAVLEEAGRLDCVRSYKEPDKEALEQLADDVLEGLGARRVTTDRFFAQPSTSTVPVEA